MKLKHTALYAKGWYKKTNLVEDVKKTLHADGYIPDTKGDIISILAREVFPLIEKRQGKDAVIDLLSGIHPCKWWMHPIDGDDTEYQYDIAVIKYFLSQIGNLDKTCFEFDDWEPDYSVLPKREED